MKEHGISIVNLESKNRLFVLGDSWCTPYFEWFDEFKEKQWGWYKNVESYIQRSNTTPHTFTTYLKNHYDVINISCGGQSNESIIYQLGLIDRYKPGDRIFMLLSHACRTRINVVPQWKPDNFHRRREVDISPNYRPRYDKDTLSQIMIDREDSWHSGDRDDEIRFYENLTNLLPNYNPVLFSWSEDFIETGINYYDFYGYRIIDEHPDLNDYHLGGYGNYLLYTMVLNWLKPNTKPIDYGDLESRRR